jgi:hypothetical protein
MREKCCSNYSRDAAINLSICPHRRENKRAAFVFVFMNELTGALDAICSFNRSNLKVTSRTTSQDVL